MSYMHVYTYGVVERELQCCDTPPGVISPPGNSKLTFITQDHTGSIIPLGKSHFLN